MATHYTTLHSPDVKMIGNEGSDHHSPTTVSSNLCRGVFSVPSTAYWPDLGFRAIISKKYVYEMQLQMICVLENTRKNSRYLIPIRNNAQGTEVEWSCFAAREQVAHQILLYTTWPWITKHPPSFLHRTSRWFFHLVICVPFFIHFSGCLLCWFCKGACIFQ